MRPVRILFLDSTNGIGLAPDRFPCPALQAADSFPRAVVETMPCAKPVVGGGNGGIPEAIAERRENLFSISARIHRLTRIQEAKHAFCDS